MRECGQQSRVAGYHHPVNRRADVDLVRCLALLSMYVAHVAPVPGPLRVLELSEYLTMPLFALLVGVGAQLGVWSDRSNAGWARSTVVRATVLIGLALALERAGAQIVIVLLHLGVLVVVAAVLARLPSGAVVAGAAAAFIGGQVLVRRASLDTVSGSWVDEIALFGWAGGPYRFIFMVVFAAAGILVSRWWLRGRRARSVLVPGVAGSALLVGAAAMLAAEQLGRVDLVPYSGTAQETVLDTLLAVGVAGVGLALARALGRIPIGRGVLSVLAGAGAMTLSLYALQVLWLAYDVRVLHPGERDDSWVNLAVLCVGSLVLAWAWHALVRAEPWRRGPIEGPVSLATGRHWPRPRS